MNTPRNTILLGDAATRMTELETSSIDCIITSPPYFRLRNYQHTGQLGLEDTINDWVDSLLLVLDEAARVLVPTGTLWLNLGDTYSTHTREGTPKKSLLLGPERLLLALSHQGWIVRNKIIWAKTNAIPSPVTDRLSCTYEIVYLLSRQPHYFFNLDAIRQEPKTKPNTCTSHQSRPSRPPRQPRSQARTGIAPHRSRRPATPPTHPNKHLRGRGIPATWQGTNADGDQGLHNMKRMNTISHPLGKNPGDVWHLPTSQYRGQHFATYPISLAERMVQAGCPEQRCAQCRRPHHRPIHRLGQHATRLTLRPTCQCPPPPHGQPTSEPGLVLDPFIGSGTTAIAAENHQRHWLGIDINTEFVAQAKERIQGARDKPPRPASRAQASKKTPAGPNNQPKGENP